MTITYTSKIAWLLAAIIVFSGSIFAQDSQEGPQTEIAMSLDAENHDHHNFVSWSYELKNDTSFFEVLRSYDGVEFSSQGYVVRDKAALSEHKYYIIDKTMLKHRLVYYKVKVYEGNQVSVSETVGLHPVNVAFDYFKIYPTPAHNNLHINLKKGHPEFEPFNALLINDNGQVIWQNEFTQRHNIVDVHTMNPGMYELEIWLPAANQRINEKILVK